MDPVQPIQMNIYQIKTYRKDLSRLHFDILIKVATRSTSPDMTTVFLVWPYGRFIETEGNVRKNEFHIMNQGSNLLEDSFRNRDNTRAPIQFRKESQLQHLKRWFFLKNRSIQFHINSTSAISLVRQNQVSIETKKPLPAQSSVS